MIPERSRFQREREMEMTPAEVAAGLQRGLEKMGRDLDEIRSKMIADWALAASWVLGVDPDKLKPLSEDIKQAACPSEVRLAVCEADDELCPSPLFIPTREWSRFCSSRCQERQKKRRARRPRPCR